MILLRDISQNLHERFQFGGKAQTISANNARLSGAFPKDRAPVRYRLDLFRCHYTTARSNHGGLQPCLGLNPALQLYYGAYRSRHGVISRSINIFVARAIESERRTPQDQVSDTAGATSCKAFQSNVRWRCSQRGRNRKGTANLFSE